MISKLNLRSRALGGGVEAGPEGVAVSLAGVSHAYDRLPALDGVSLVVGPGELVFLAGPVGAGKSTLLKVLHGDISPQRGEGWVAGLPLHRGRGAARGLRARVGIVYQDLALLSRLTALENVVYAIQVADLWTPHAEAVARAESLLDQVGLGGRLRAYPTQLSGGQQQRLAIARAMAPRPQVLLADEPTGNLDADSARSVLSLLARLAAAGTTVIAATHGPTLDSRIVRLEAGRVVGDASGARGLWLT